MRDEDSKGSFENIFLEVGNSYDKGDIMFMPELVDLAALL